MRKIVVPVGKVLIGDSGHIAIQTMCNTHTSDIDSSYKQCVELSGCGAEVIRLTTQGEKEVIALKEIKRRLRLNGINTPLVADTHFSYKTSLAAAIVADKVRINPGNYAKDPLIAKIEFAKLIALCKEHRTAIRIGINHGSLGERIVERYGDSPEGMAEVAKEWISMAQDNDFENIVISLKSSNTTVMVEAYKRLHSYMVSQGVVYPLHLGVTETGNGDTGRIKSAVGIASLLSAGIGDTIRVSLTENPLKEIPVARHIVEFFKEQTPAPIVVFTKQDENIALQSSMDSGEEVKTARKHYDYESHEEFIVKTSCEMGSLLMEKIIDDIDISVNIKGIPLTAKSISNFRSDLLQAARREFSKPEYIACPGCGRTLFNLEATFNEVKRRTSHLNGCVIAVMGCIVNGPGEMADADYGYVGEGKGKVAIYRGKEPIIRGISEDKAVDKLLEIIEEDFRNRGALPQNG